MLLSGNAHLLDRQSPIQQAACASAPRGLSTRKATETNRSKEKVNTPKTHVHAHSARERDTKSHHSALTAPHLKPTDTPRSRKGECEGEELTIFLFFICGASSCRLSHPDPHHHPLPAQALRRRLPASPYFCGGAGEGGGVSHGMRSCTYPFGLLFSILRSLFTRSSM